MVFTTSTVPTKPNEEGIEVPVGGKIVSLGVDGDTIALLSGASEKDVRWTPDGDIVVRGAFYTA